ncbi:MAG TPA: ATP-binding protein [Kofleriaceae bacterium]|nr:ATP-binding protein [Kofleriaceae bacterium]
MRLRVRFTVWFLLVAVVPIAAAALITRELLSRRYRADYADRRAAAERIASREAQRLEDSARSAAVTLASGDDSLVGGLYQELAKAGGMYTHPVRAWLQERAGTTMRRSQLDVLFIVDGGGQVLESPHDPDARDQTSPELVDRARKLRADPCFVREAVLGPGGSMRSLLVAEAADTSREGPRSLVVIAGEAVDSDWLAAMRSPGIIDNVRVVDPAGAELVPPPRHWSGGTPIRVSLEAADGKPAAYLEVDVSRQDLDAVLRTITLWSASIAGAAVLVTTLLALLLARRMTRELDSLVTASEAAGRGDLDHRVEVRSSDEIGALADSFNWMMEELKGSKEKLVIAERVAAWQEMARSLAHEIKNPLTPIQMAVETLRRAYAKKHPSFDATFDESTATVLEETARLKRIVTEFSEFARLPKPQTGPCDLNAIVSAALSLYAGTVEVLTSLDGELGEVLCDRDQITQVLLNLLENARDALTLRDGGPAGGRITVITRREGGARAQLIVEDNGPGFPAGVRDRLFTPYVTTKQGKGGSGLGLAIIHRIVIEHAGAIDISDAPGGGARVTITLPLANPKPEPVAPGGRGRSRPMW